MPVDDVKTGMKGIGRTAVQGNQLVEFQVEIISVLRNISPQKSVILAKLTGANLEQTGVAAGMSGSPVYINGKLIGAVAFSWPFSKEAIAGITPIDDMTGMPEIKMPEIKSKSVLSHQLLDFIFNTPDFVSAENCYNKFLEMFPLNFTHTAGELYKPLPLAMNGFSGTSYPVLQKWWENNGFMPMAVNTSTASNTNYELKEGAPVAVTFVTGDLDIGAIGTITYIDKNRVFAFGHTLFNLGDISLPMASSQIDAVISSLYSSFKIGNIGKTIGTFRQDLPSSIFGLLEEKPIMIPMKLKMTYGKQEKKYNFLMGNHHLLSPVIANYVFSETLASTESSMYEGTLSVKGTINIEGHNTVNIDNVFSGFLNIPEASTFLSSVFAYLINNEFEETKIKDVDLSAIVSSEQKTADLLEVRYDKSDAKRGDKIKFKIIVKPYQKPAASYDYELKISDKFNTGTYYILIGGADALNKFDYAYYYKYTEFENLEQIIKLVNTIKRNDNIYIRIFSPKASLIVKSKLMSDLPPSYFDVIDSPQASGAANRIMIEHVMEDSVASEYVIKGAKRIAIEIKD